VEKDDKMKRRLSWVILTVGLLVVSYQIGKLFRNEPRIVLAHPNLDFGVIPVGVKVRKELVLMNSGDAPLEISGIRTGCGCLEASIGLNSTILPGGQVSVVVSIELEEKAYTQGKVVDLYIFSNDPNNSVRKVVVSARPNLNDQGFPRVIDFGESMELDLPRKRELLRGGNSTEPGGWTVAEFDERTLLVERFSVNERAGFLITLKRTSLIGEVFTKLSFANGTESRSEEVLVTANVLGDFMVSPGMLIVGPTYEANPTFSETVKISRIQKSESPQSSFNVKNIAISNSLKDTIVCSVDSQNTRRMIINNAYGESFSKAFLSPHTFIGAVTFTILSEGGNDIFLNLPVVVVIGKTRVTGL